MTINRPPAPPRPRLAGTLLGLSLLALASTGAAAQYAGGWGGGYAYNRPFDEDGPGPNGPYARPLRPGEIVERLEEAGYDDVERPRFDGRTYRVDVVHPKLGAMRLVVDAYRGVIVGRVRNAANGPSGRDLREAELQEPDFREAQPPLRGYHRPRTPSPYDEMPDASAPRRQRIPSAALPDAPTPRALPSDRRLAPRDGPVAPQDGPATEAAPVPKPAREAARPDPATAPAPRAPAGPAGAQPYGVNPDRAPGPRPAAARPPGGQGPAAAKPRPAAEAAAAPTTAPAGGEGSARKPVRVIQGVTPLNVGPGSGPAPDATPPAAGTPPPQ